MARAVWFQDSALARGLISNPNPLPRQHLPLLHDTAMFSTYIPFPTIAADTPKYNPRGYWRGPIWLDPTYFAIL